MISMKRLIVLLLVVTLPLFGRPASADEDKGAPTTRRELPAGRDVEIDGKPFVAFTPHEYAEVVKLEDDYLWFFDNWTLKLRSYDLALTEKQSALGELSLCRDSLKLVTSDRDILRTAWNDERRLRIDEQNAARAKEWIPWALVIIESIGFGVLGVVSASR